MRSGALPPPSHRMNQTLDKFLEEHKFLSKERRQLADGLKEAGADLDNMEGIFLLVKSAPDWADVKLPAKLKDDFRSVVLGSFGLTDEPRKSLALASPVAPTPRTQTEQRILDLVELSNRTKSDVEARTRGLKLDTDDGFASAVDLLLSEAPSPPAKHGQRVPSPPYHSSSAPALKPPTTVPDLPSSPPTPCPVCLEWFVEPDIVRRACGHYACIRCSLIHVHTLLDDHIAVGCLASPCTNGGLYTSSELFSLASMADSKRIEKPPALLDRFHLAHRSWR